MTRSLLDNVWREGSRIRRADGTGYGDVVPDAQIWEHVATAVEDHDLDSLGFAVAVLTLRGEERDDVLEKAQAATWCDDHACRVSECREQPHEPAAQDGGQADG